jgi:Protein of unknown function (DUF3347)
MKRIIFTTAITALLTITCQAQINNSRTEAVKIYGNCGMCETNIEKAGNKKKISIADWNEETKIATITYNSKKTSLDALLKNIALAGYDNAKFLAPDAAYNKLPGCCKYERVLKVTVKTPLKDTAMMVESNAGQTDTGNTTTSQQVGPFQGIFDKYFAIKDGLVKTEMATAAASARELLSALNAVKMDILKTDEHTAWMKVEKDLKMDAQHISESKEIGHQRDHFIALSKSMIALIKATKPAETVYLQHCPMANQGKGADWLSKEYAVKNPYYGTAMLSCGKTIDTIK